ncbi:GDSL esterase/lipase, partial [Trifolium pratense]
RKMVVMGLAPIGCAPRYMWEYGTENGDCVEPINDMSIEFNFLMRYVVEKLAEELPDANIIFCDALTSRPRPAVDLGSTRVGSCAYRQKWRAVMLPTISGGTSSIQLIQ